VTTKERCFYRSVKLLFTSWI